MSKDLHQNQQTYDQSEEQGHSGSYIVPKVQPKIQPKISSKVQAKLMRGKSKQEGPETAVSSGKLPEEVQAKMENSFNQDFSGVTIHKDSSSAQNINAKAYTQGSDIHFAPGEYNPSSKTGQELIGHELTHVVQQKQNKVGPGEIHGKGLEINQDAGLEKEADDAGKLASEGLAVNVMGTSNNNGVQRKEDDLTIKAGSVALYGEGDMKTIKYIHWPGTSSSGVTLGKGYDMGARTAAAITADLTNAGVPADKATAIAAAAGKTGSDANDFVTENKASIGPISDDAVINLFQVEWNKQRAIAKNVATNTSAQKDGGGHYTNARGREIKDGKEAGTYVMTAEEWDSMHPALIDFITDLKFHGGYYLYERVSLINAAVKSAPNDQLGQLKAVRKLFDAGGSFEKYSESLNFNKYTGTETLYGTQVQFNNEFRRDKIRTTYLDQVIKTIEGGGKVEVTGYVNTGPTTAPKPKEAPKDIISDSVGLSGKNVKADVITVQTLLYKAGYNITISGTADKDTINAIIAYQKTIFNKSGSADGLISPFKTTIGKLKEYQNKSRIPQEQTVNKQVETPVKIVQQAYENYKAGTINMVSLGSKLKQQNRFCPQTVLNVFNALDSGSRDNLAYTMANQSTDAELAAFYPTVLKRMSEELGGWFNTTSWGENSKQQARIDKILNPAKTTVTTATPAVADPKADKAKLERAQAVEQAKAWAKANPGDSYPASGTTATGGAENKITAKPGDNIDCSGLIRVCIFGVTGKDYYVEQEGTGVQRLVQQSTKIDLNDVEAGDLLALNNGRHFGHIGMVVEVKKDGQGNVTYIKMIDSGGTAGSGKSGPRYTNVTIGEEYWGKRIDGAYRWN